MLLDTNKKRWHEFARDEAGSMTIFALFMVVLIIAVSGAAVDMTRHEAVRSEVQTTLDTAILAATDLDQTREPRAVVDDYMNKSGFGSLNVAIDYVTEPNSRNVWASANSSIDTFFMRMSGVDTLNVRAESAALESISNVEISLALDISGSMDNNNRVALMKPAASSFVAKVMSEENVGTTTINLVPFAGHVNPGTEMFEFFGGERPDIPQDETSTPGDFFPPWAQAISNVVLYFDTDGDDIFERAHKIEGWSDSDPRDFDDLLAGAVGYVAARDSKITSTSQFLGASIKGGTQETRYFTVRGDTNGTESDLGPTKNRGKLPGSTYNFSSVDFTSHAGDYTPPSATGSVNANITTSCVEIADAEFETTEFPIGGEFVPYFHYWPMKYTLRNAQHEVVASEDDDPTADPVMDWGWCPEDDTAIQYYSDNEAQLIEFINNLKLHDGTGIQYALKYALSLLDPDTSAAISAMIDAGLVNEVFRGRPMSWSDVTTDKYIVLMTDGQITDQYRPVDPGDAINGEVELLNQTSGAATNFSNRSNNIGNLQAQCDLAKSLGVTVFTIAFETNDAAATDMRNCASSDSHAYRVSGSEISSAFNAIARQINTLRLTQ